MNEIFAVLALALGIPAAAVSLWQIVDRFKSFRRKRKVR